MNMPVKKPWWWIHASHRSSMRTVVCLLAALLLLACFPVAYPVFFSSSNGIAGYLPAHTLLETTAIVVSMLVFSVGWNAHRGMLSGNVVILACLFFGVGWLDFFHTISYAGMPDFVTHNDWQKHLSYWLTARLLAAFSLLIVGIRPWQSVGLPKTRHILLLSIVGLIALVNWAVLAHPQVIPSLFIKGEGLTPFKKNVEYLTIAINLVAATLFWNKLKQPQSFNAALLFGACCVLALGEVFFTLYTTMAGTYNVYGHVYKTIGYLIIYRAIVVEAIETPYKRFIESQNSLTLAAQSSKTGLWDCDLTTGRLHFSEELKRLLGFDAAQAPQSIEAIVPLLHPDDMDRLRVQLDAKLNSRDRNPRFDDEFRLRHTDGSYRWFLSRGEVRKDVLGRPVQILGANIDISERRLAEEQFRCAFEAAPNAMLMVNSQGRIVLANLQTTAMFGYTNAELIDAPIELLVPETHQQDHQAFVHEYCADATGRRMASGKELFGLHKTGRKIPVEVGLNPLNTSQGRFVIASVVDLHEQQQALTKIQHLVNFDALTGLPNRTLLKDRLRQVLEFAHHKGQTVGVLFIDLDHFKNINDTLGHHVGDMVLLEISSRLQTHLKEKVVVSRLGGDEFFVVLANATTENVVQIAHGLRTVLSQPLIASNHRLKITPSIGIAMYPHDGVDFETLYQCSDTAMYRAKQDGRNTVRFFTKAMQEQALHRHQLETALHQAIEKHQLTLHYQPQLDISTGQIIGVEALLRWHHPEMGAISPAEFIPIAEKSGQILEIGEWVLRTATQQLKTWFDLGLPAMTMAVNISTIQFRQVDLVIRTMKILTEIGLEPQYLELEITEGAMADDPVKATELISELHSLGVGIAIDDFGTGYSSLSYLKHFKIDKLKIDQSFVRDIDEENTIVGTIIQMANNLGFKTIAEGVETAGQLDFLRAQKCTEVQGYLFSKPLPANQIPDFVRHQNHKTMACAL